MTDKEFIEKIRELVRAGNKDSNEELYRRVEFYVKSALYNNNTNRSIADAAQSVLQNLTPAETLVAIQLLGLLLSFLRHNLDVIKDLDNDFDPQPNERINPTKTDRESQDG